VSSSITLLPCSSSYPWFTPHPLPFFLNFQRSFVGPFFTPLGSCLRIIFSRPPSYSFFALPSQHIFSFSNSVYPTILPVCPFLFFTSFPSCPCVTWPLYFFSVSVLFLFFYPKLPYLFFLPFPLPLPLSLPFLYVLFVCSPSPQNVLCSRFLVY